MEQKNKYRFFKLFSIYASAIVFGLILAIMFDGPKIHAVVFYLVVIFGLYIYIKRENIVWQSWFENKCSNGLLQIIVSVLFVLFLIVLIIAIRTAIWKEGITEKFEFDIFVFIGTCCLAPFVEEFLCRGIILDILKERLCNTFSIIISSVIFYIIHGNPMNVGSLIFGLFAGWIMIKVKNLIPCIIIHLVWNNVIYFLPIIALHLSNII